MSGLHNSEDNHDLYLKIVHGDGRRFEVRVDHYFSRNENQPPCVTVSSNHHLQWEGRELHEAERSRIKRAIELIDIRAAPIVASNLNGDCYRLEIKGAEVFARYEWWGSIPPEWYSLGPLLEALHVLAIPK
ncbi:MAG: hypothetical protein OEX19_02920 [Gammaproteobacteria bacterium]|nr:hypothetical protein [Gammaproteobacteria bacterium]